AAAHQKRRPREPRDVLPVEDSQKHRRQPQTNRIQRQRRRIPQRRFHQDKGAAPYKGDQNQEQMSFNRAAHLGILSSRVLLGFSVSPCLRGGCSLPITAITLRLWRLRAIFLLLGKP